MANEVFDVFDLVRRDDVGASRRNKLFEQRVVEATTNDGVHPEVDLIEQGERCAARKRERRIRR
ncbi:hypothetical protein [Bowdeniella nasicola]|uniref:hypothetical protein n=1 Tax=Bowdeniella nasicola TaxID=208480 RepID=UPI001FEA8080|nr:hypothetical protein [Bowdeniella nasicola]